MKVMEKAKRESPQFHNRKTFGVQTNMLKISQCREEGWNDEIFIIIIIKSREKNANTKNVDAQKNVKHFTYQSSRFDTNLKQIEN